MHENVNRFGNRLIAIDATHNTTRFGFKLITCFVIDTRGYQSWTPANFLKRFKLGMGAVPVSASRLQNLASRLADKETG